MAKGQMANSNRQESRISDLGSRIEDPKSEIADPRSDPPAPPPAPKKREDQVQCAACGHFGCPVTCGKRYRTEGILRYRQCSRCGWAFSTVQRHGSAVEERQS